MRKLLALLLMVVLTVATLGGVAIATDVDEEGSYVNDADIDLVIMVDEVLSDLGSALESDEPTAQIATKIDASVTALQDLVSHVFSQEVSQDYLDQSNVVQQAASDLINKLVALRQMYADGGDEATVAPALEEVSVALDKYVAALEDLDGILDDTKPVDEWRDFYLIMLILAASLAFGSFVWAFMWPESITERLKNRHQIAYVSLAPLAGAAITYFSYKLIPAGGEYMIAWGAIVFGLIVYGREVLVYRKATKTTN